MRLLPAMLSPACSGSVRVKGVGAQFPGRVVEGDAVLVGVPVDGDGVRGDEVAAEVEVERHLDAGQAVGLNREVDGGGAAAKGQLGSAQAGDAKVLEALRLPYRHRENRAGVPLEIVEGIGRVDDAVGHDDDPGGVRLAFRHLPEGVEQPAGIARRDHVFKPVEIPRSGLAVEGVELEIVFPGQFAGQTGGGEGFPGGVDPVGAARAGGEAHALGAYPAAPPGGAATKWGPPRCARGP